MSNKTPNPLVGIIGAGLAGCEAAYQLTRHGVQVTLYEQKPETHSPAHVSPDFAELVCSNSLRSDNLTNAAGLLKAELRELGSWLMRVAEDTRVPAGTALAVDRQLFSRTITQYITSNPDITLSSQTVTTIPDERPLMIATGPLTSAGLAQTISTLTGSSSLFFYDAIAPIIEADSIDWTKVFCASRYGKGGSDDYVNCPLDRQQYEHFVHQLLAADAVDLHTFENAAHFTGCQPIEAIARQGAHALAFGPLKPVGLIDPHTNVRPYAVVQLRSENISATAYNLVGFQTRLTYSAQKELIRTIPGLEHARILRYGSMHRNTFIDSPRLLNPDLSLKMEPGIYFAGQITGVEGYIESIANGWLTAAAILQRLKAMPFHAPPADTAMGGLYRHLMNAASPHFQPTNVHFGLIASPPGIKNRRQRREAIAASAMSAIGEWKRLMDF